MRAVGPATLRVDGESIVDIADGQRGGAFFGLGSPEVRGTVELEAGRTYAIDVEYPVDPGRS